MPSREITRENAMIVWLSAVALIVLGFVVAFFVNAIAGFILFLVGMAVGAVNSLAFRIRGSETDIDSIGSTSTGKSIPEQNKKPDPIPVFPKSKTTLAFCPNCKSGIPNGISFCPFCGTSFQAKENALAYVVCSNCERLIPDDAKFCPFCAARVHTT